MVKCKETEYDRQWLDNAPVDTNKLRITEKLILDALTQQVPPGEEGKYAAMVKQDFDTIAHLKLEYKSIAIIDNLSNLIGLTKLQLCNNVIEKIENLDDLVNLTWLDLSFNSIRKIEGLDNLKKIEVLNLHRNFVTTLENMDNLLRLEMFHISSNKLDNYENVKYLRNFLRLKSVSFAGNPMAKNPNFVPLLIAYVPQLLMLDYKYIPRHEREFANAKYKNQVDRLVQNEDKLIRRASVVEAEEQVKETYKEAFVDQYQGDLVWAALYENDPEGQAILKLNDTEDIQAVYRELFRSVSTDIFEKGMKIYEMRRNEQTAYDIATKEELEQGQADGNRLTEDFVEYAVTTLKDIEILVALMEEEQRRLHHDEISELPPEFKEYESQLNDMTREYVRKLHSVWTTLIEKEIEFNENLEDVNDLLDQAMREIIQNWQETLRGQFAALRDSEQQLFERLIESLVTYGQFRASDTSIPESLKELVMDKDALQNHLQVSHDKHIAVIDGREDQLSRQLKEWQENFSIGMQIKEYHRNRGRLQETSHFTNWHYKRLEDTRAFSHTTVFIPSVRADQECTDAKECKPLQWYERLTKRLKAKEKKFKATMMPKGKGKGGEGEKVTGKASFAL